MSKKRIISCEIINDVRVTTYEDNSQKFEPVNQSTQKIIKQNIFQKIKNWWNGLVIKPYIKVKDLADPFDDRTDPDSGSDGKAAIETGIKISF